MDLGCGLGHGLRSLQHKVAPGPFRLLGIDENPDCLSVAAQTLGLQDLASNIDRMRSELLPSGLYRWRYKSGQLFARDGINLVQSNLLVRDPDLHTFLERQALFDAVTLWFIGVHKATANTELAQFFEVRGDADYRILVEDAVIELAKEMLAPRGLLHVAIRGGFSSQAEAREQTASEYESYFVDQGFRLISVDAIPYAEPQSTGSIVVRSASNERINAQPVYGVSMIGQRT